MPRLPAVKQLATLVRAAARGRSTVGGAADYLVAHRDDLAQFESAEHLVFCTDADYAPPGTTAEMLRDAKALSHQIAVVRSALAAELWARELFIDADVLEDVIFYVAREGHADPILGVLEWIRDARANRPGLVVFPLHSFGVIGAGILRPSQARIAFVNPERGYAVSPQTNNVDRTISFLEDVRSSFGIEPALPVELLHHWHRSRPIEWFERNPVLVVRTVLVPGSYYGSEWLLISQVRATNGLLAMLATLQPEVGDRPAALFSTRTMNNFQTLDIHHYLTLSAGVGRKKELLGQCIPIHASRSLVSELSDLAIDIDPAHWNRRDPLTQSVHDAVDVVFREYLRVRVGRRPDDARGRTVRKMFESLGYFRRSFQSSSNSWSTPVALATAFEMLLLDAPRGIHRSLVRRTQLLLRGVPGTRRLQAAVDQLYAARSALVHRGDVVPDLDLGTAREAYVRCFVELSRRLDRLPRVSTNPLSDLMNDH